MDHCLGPLDLEPCSVVIVTMGDNLQNTRNDKSKKKKKKAEELPSLSTPMFVRRFSWYWLKLGVFSGILVYAISFPSQFLYLCKIAMLGDTGICLSDRWFQKMQKCCLQWNLHLQTPPMSIWHPSWVKHQQFTVPMISPLKLTSIYNLL